MSEPIDARARAVAREAATLAMQLHRQGRLDDAIELYGRALGLDAELVPAWCNLGVAHRARGDVDAAEDAFRRAVALDPSHAVAIANLASVAEARNQPEEARRLARRAHELDPALPASTLVLARLARSAGDLDDAVRLLDRLDPATVPSELRPRLHTERGQCLDRLGRADEAFAAFTRANEASAALPASRSVDPRRFPRSVATVARATAAMLSAARGARLERDDGPPPIFVLGFPRSGTTLTETVLSAHPALRASDELPIFEGVLAQVQRLLPRRLPYPAAFTEPLDAADRRTLREAYRSEVARGVPGDGPLVDKLPLNLVHLGGIAAVFPDAPIILVLRDPRDSALSCFMQDFVPNSAMVQMHSLESIVALQEQVFGLWLAHRDALPNPVLVVRYEDLVADQPAQARRMLDHVGLAWDDRVARFWESARGTHISTPSHQDVAKPIFTRARGRWRRYEQHLAPVLPRLHRLAGALGYPG